MGWTKHQDAVDAHERELRRTHAVMRKLVQGVARMSPRRAVQTWRDISTFTKMASALSGTSRNADYIEFNLSDAISALEGFDGHVQITFGKRST